MTCRYGKEEPMSDLRAIDGWKFTERVYNVRYLDHSPLAGSAPSRAVMEEETI